jgi:hypothetical protein
LVRSRRPQQAAPVTGGAERPGGQSGRGRVGHDDLARGRSGLGVHGRRRGRPGEEQLAVHVAREEEVEKTAVHAGVHAQRRRARARLRTRDLPQRDPHPVQRPRRVRLVVLAVEEEQERVAAELEDSATVLVGHLEEARQRGVHDPRQLLGTRPAEPGQALRELREAGDVHERRRALHREHALVGPTARPFNDQSREIRRQCLHARIVSDGGVDRNAG